MSVMIQAIRGMNDILPTETPYWQTIETILRDLVKSFGFQEIRFPLLEKTELFKRSVGENTDIVEKEMYTFLDRNQESLTLRPEGTAVCVRAAIEHGLLHANVKRLWYTGPFFRYERPQKGRYRQFYHFAAEIFGIATPDIDAELILLSATLFKQLALLPHVTLEINSLGSLESRQRYRTALIEYLTLHENQLDEDSRRRLTTNPLRILDSKNQDTQAILANAPQLLDHLDEESRQHFETLKQYLDHLNISYVVNPRLVRGLDYYTKTVFEWVTNELGAQGTVCAGGRYDGLVEQLGGPATPALGFAIGMERLILLYQQIHPTPIEHSIDIYCMTDSEAAFQKALALTNELRLQIKALSIILHCGGGSFKNQFKKADKSGARMALILGQQELDTHSVTLKFLRETIPQVTVSQADLVDFFTKKNPSYWVRLSNMRFSSDNLFD